MEGTSLQNEDGRGRRYKEQEGIVPTSLTVLQALQIVLFELQNVQDEFPLKQLEEKGPTCHTSESATWWNLTLPSETSK